ncbi:ATP-binding protein [Hydrogenophaga sp. 5NK40-0174]|uniref:sensor histidine kinase n=1 Tax=Hydrogenophaga sp. 5NK40-0174 TaxID=3127649 RepID=UPI00310A297C
MRSLLGTKQPMFWTRRFAVLSLLCVLVTASGSATWLSRTVSERMIMRNAELAQEFVDSLVRMHRGDRFFSDQSDVAGMEMLFGELGRMPGLVHANVYDPSHKLIWSTNRSAIGESAGDNHELEEALEGELAVESELLETVNFIKPEHAFIPDDARDAIEVYIPVRNEALSVVGVAELYMRPQRLIQSIHELTRGVWLACAFSGLLIYGALVWLVMMADRQIARQQRTIVANESLVAVGDMASAVAHGLRNPLASIRSSAELISMGPEKPQADDIMSEVDRLQSWISKLLAYAQQGGRDLTPVDVRELTDNLLTPYKARMRSLNVVLTCEWPSPLPLVLADAPALEQAMDNLIANAIDAMPEGGKLRISASRQGKALRVVIADTGVGMSAEDLQRVFVPFHTTKRTGLGVGLPLARRTLERLGGSLRLRSQLGEGTQAELSLPIAGNKVRT